MIICALEFERSAFLEHGVAQHADVMCCGPGSAAFADHLHEKLAVGGPDRPLILAGLAGALDPELNRGHAFKIREVIDEDDERWAPTLCWGDPEEVTFVTTTSAREPLTSPEMKAAFRASTGADLVDLESAIFARMATTAGRTWAIVRGVSDDADQSLPRNIGAWVDEHGATRPLTVFGSILRNPRLLADLPGLRSASKRAMKNVAGLILEHITR